MEVGASTSASASSMNKDSVCIREVWASNLEEEFKLIEGIREDYPYLAVDTAFPGFVHKPQAMATQTGMRSDHYYAALKANVDTLYLIQLGFTFCDKNGKLPEILCGRDVLNKCVWQFNFKEFDLNDENNKYAADSIHLLKNSGIDFQKNREEGVESENFKALLLSSGIVQNSNIKWITFQGAYDFGYMLKLVTCQELPSTQRGFFRLLGTYFPTFYDVKHLIRFSNRFYGGLERVAGMLNLERIAGSSHQAGSDSLLTLSVFMKLMDTQLDWNGGSVYQYMMQASYLGSVFEEFSIKLHQEFVLD